MAQIQYQETVLTFRMNGKDYDDVLNKLTDKADYGANPVNTMGRARRAKGFKRKNRNFHVTAEMEVTIDGRSLHQIADAGTEFDMIKKPDRGPTVTWKRCQILSISDSQSDGESARSVEIVAIERLES